MVPLKRHTKHQKHTKTYKHQNIQKKTVQLDTRINGSTKQPENNKLKGNSKFLPISNYFKHKQIKFSN